MKRRPLTRAVVRGLLELVALAESGSPDDILGEAARGRELRRRWSDVVSACLWVRSEQARREAQKEQKR